MPALLLQAGCGMPSGRTPPHTALPRGGAVSSDQPWIGGPNICVILAPDSGEVTTNPPCAVGGSILNPLVVGSAGVLNCWAAAGDAAMAKIAAMTAARIEMLTMGTP
jgi:hypothetical protein